MITKNIPNNWRNLQLECRRILRECGFKVEMEKKLQTARGFVVVDIYAEEHINNRKNIMICECKLWNKKIPQREIHAFRTVISDIGANVGIIISKNGFQSGAYKANNFTNIKLVNWQEFEELFLKEWLEVYFVKRLMKITDEISFLGEPVSCKRYNILNTLSKMNQNKLLELDEKCIPFNVIITHFISVGYKIFSNKTDIPYLPIKKFLSIDYKNCFMPLSFLETTSYRVFLDLASKHARNIKKSLNKILNSK